LGADEFIQKAQEALKHDCEKRASGPTMTRGEQRSFDMSQAQKQGFGSAGEEKEDQGVEAKLDSTRKVSFHEFLDDYREKKKNGKEEGKKRESKNAFNLQWNG